MAKLKSSSAAAVTVLLLSAVLGGLLCLMKGEGGGLADALGNLSAPYVIVAVAAGLTARRWWAAALLGVMATEATVGGFYTAWALYFGHEVSQSAVSIWAGAGIVSGLFLGVTGWSARKHRGLRYVVPALLILEPVLTEGAAPLLARVGFGSGWGVVGFSNVLAYVIEVTVGVIVLFLVRRNRRSRRRDVRDRLA